MPTPARSTAGVFLRCAHGYDCLVRMKPPIEYTCYCFVCGNYRAIQFCRHGELYYDLAQNRYVPEQRGGVPDANDS